MDQKTELNELCQKIKRMIPSNKIRNDATEPFTKFLNSLKEKGISEEEIDSIKRAYNYFNHIISFYEPNTGSEKNSETDGSIDTTVKRVTPLMETGRIEPLMETGRIEPTSKPTSRESPVLQDSPLQSEEMIQLLLSLYELENKRMAIADMKTIAITVLKSMPEIKHDWMDAISKDEILKKKRIQLLDRLEYQVEVAELLNNRIPESHALLDAATLVLAIAQGEDAKEKSGGGTREDIKEQQRISQQSRLVSKVDELAKELPPAIIDAQEKVIVEVTKLESMM